MHWDLASHECKLIISDGDCKKLVVVLSHKDNFAFYKRQFKASKLFILDKRHNYYSLYPGMVTDVIQTIVDDFGFENVIFVGMSKGGYGSLLLSSMLARRKPRLPCRALAFSPPAILYPMNSDLPFPSYKGMIRRAENNDILAENLRKYGNLTKQMGLPNVFWRIVYGERNKVDATEVSKFDHPQVQKYPIPFSFHGSTIPFTLNRLDRAQLDGEVAQIYKSADNDADLRATLPQSCEELKQQLLQASWIPTLEDLVSDTLKVSFMNLPAKHGT